MEKSNESKNKTASIQVISRAGTILKTLKEYPNGLSLGQIAKQVGLAKSTVQRIVHSLEQEKFVVALSSRNGFRLGPGLAILGLSVHYHLREKMHPFLQRLSKELNETVDLAIFDKGKAYFIDQIAATHRLQAISKIGSSFPLHCTANGKAILATLTKTEITQILPDLLFPYTDQTLTSHSELIKELETVRNNDGIAYDKEEHTIGICAIGATLSHSDGEILAISIPLPSFRFYGNEEKIISALLETIKEINISDKN